MNAAEARALTEVRKGESWVDFILRSHIYPRIRESADWGASTADCSILPGHHDWQTFNERLEALKVALVAQGYGVELVWPSSWSLRIDVTVRVSW